MTDFSKNYFAIFGLDTDFRLNQGQLSEAYRKLQKLIHPDRYVNATDQERRVAMQHAVTVNQGFEILKKPLSRAIYLLSLLGVDIEADQDTRMDPAFLMEQMELRERLSEIMQATDPFAEIDSVMQHLTDFKADIVAQLEQQFASANETNLPLARDLVRKFQFIDKLQSEAEAAEAKLEDAL